MQELDACLEKARDIQAKTELILEIKSRTMSPKNQIISGMPRGGGDNSNAMDDYLIRLERLTKAKVRLQKTLDKEWETAVNKIKKRGMGRADTIELMRLRFYCGLSWKKCAQKMQKTYPNDRWSTNKCFRVYRKVCINDTSKI